MTNERPVSKGWNYAHADFCHPARREIRRFRRFSAAEIARRDAPSPDIFWLKDDSLEDIDSLPAPDVLAAEIVGNLEAALAQFHRVSLELAGEEEAGRGPWRASTPP